MEDVQAAPLNSEFHKYTGKSSLGFPKSESSDDGQLRRRGIKGRMLWRQKAQGFEEANNLCNKRRKVPVTSTRLETTQYSLGDIFILNKEKEIWALVLGKQKSNKWDWV